jgi:hypothetical protein
MRPIPGFERPATQWTFAALALVLIGIVIAQGVILRNERQRTRNVHADSLNARLERDEMQLRLAREQSAREALAIEVGRLRGPRPGPSGVPSLTLSPHHSRGAQPPEPTVSPPAPDQVIELRLLLPPGANPRQVFTIVVRGWSSGETLWSRAGLAAVSRDGREAVAAPMAGDVLARGAYEILLTAKDGSDVASYEMGVR